MIYPEPMVSFLPFDGLIPKLGADEDISSRVSPPYDVIEEEEKKNLQSKPFNITRITLGRIDGQYANAAEELTHWIKKGKLRRRGKESFYIYRQSFKESGKELTRIGLMGRLRLEPYENGNIMPHEETSPKVKEDRLNLLRATSSHLESIFGICDQLETQTLHLIKEESKEVFRFSDPNGITHSFSMLEDPGSIKTLTSSLSKRKILIADGHHRYETALRYSMENPRDEEKKFILATIVASNDPGLIIRPTHRLLRSEGFAAERFLATASNDFGIWEMKDYNELEMVMNRSKRVILGVVLQDGRIYALEHLKDPNESPLWSVDAYVCEKSIIGKALQSSGTETPIKVEYDHDLESVEKKMALGQFHVAIILSPPKLDVIWKVAREGMKMPKKSTYFWPKIWSGFVVYQMR